MPKVGGRHYPYTPAGQKAAQAASKRTGKPVQNAKPPMKGGKGGSGRKR